jgi:hypothetical protein
MKISTVTVGLALCLSILPLGSFAAQKTEKKAVAAATMYECTKCHMKVTAAVAKKDHYKDPMDGGTLAPVKATPKAAKAGVAKPSAAGSMGM